MTWKMALEITLALSLLGGCGKDSNDAVTGTNCSNPNFLTEESCVEAGHEWTAPTAPDSHVVSVRTSLGEFVIELDPEAAPDTVANFLSYVDEGFYDGADGHGATTFHRVIADFMIQGGGLRADGTRKDTRDPVGHEGPNGLLNLRGTVAMARTSDPDSGTSQFFVNHADNSFLDHVSETEPGYVVFGKVRSGMETVDTIAAVQTDDLDVPEIPVVFQAVVRVPD
jgi:cyclophilin family peptidyl-prolyl cis-trans isomerase